MGLLISLIVWLIVLGILYLIGTAVIAELWPIPLATKILRLVFLLFLLLVVVDIFFGSGYLPRVPIGR